MSHFIQPSPVSNSLRAWIQHYLSIAVRGVRSEAITKKITLHLHRFADRFQVTYGHDRITLWVRRDVLSWQQHLQEQGLAAATINNHLASLSAFATWINTEAPQTSLACQGLNRPKSYYCGLSVCH